MTDKIGTHFDVCINVKRVNHHFIKFLFLRMFLAIFRIEFWNISIYPNIFDLAIIAMQNYVFPTFEAKM